MPESPDTEAIAARSEAAKVTGSWQPWWDDIDALLAALATAEERAEGLRKYAEDCGWAMVNNPHVKALEAKLAAAEAVVEAAERTMRRDSGGYDDYPDWTELTDALANYHKATGPQAETES